MADFVELWVYLASTPLFGLTATLVTYVVAQAVYERLGQAPWANPVLWSVVAIGSAPVLTGTSYPSYFAGAQFIHVLPGPAVVALAWPLWRRRAELRARGARLVLTGVPAMAAVFAVLTGMVGAVSAKALFGLLRVHDWSERGFALGTTSHGIGAAAPCKCTPMRASAQHRAAVTRAGRHAQLARRSWMGRTLGTPGHPRYPLTRACRQNLSGRVSVTRA